jgi:hypothetical protein
VQGFATSLKETDTFKKGSPMTQKLIGALSEYGGGQITSEVISQMTNLHEAFSSQDPLKIEKARIEGVAIASKISKSSPTLSTFLMNHFTQYDPTKIRAEQAENEEKLWKFSGAPVTNASQAIKQEQGEKVGFDAGFQFATKPNVLQLQPVAAQPTVESSPAARLFKAGIVEAESKAEIAKLNTKLAEQGVIFQNGSFYNLRTGELEKDLKPENFESWVIGKTKMNQISESKAIDLISNYRAAGAVGGVIAKETARAEVGSTSWNHEISAEIKNAINLVSKNRLTSFKYDLQKLQSIAQEYAEKNGKLEGLSSTEAARKGMELALGDERVFRKSSNESKK